MLEFKDITLIDKGWMQDLISRSNYRGCEYNFTTLYIWRNVFNTQVCRFNNFMLIKSGKKDISFLFPPGEGDLAQTIELLEKYAADNKIKFHMHSAPQQAKDQIEQLFPGKYDFIADRNTFDYIYLSEKLITLSGKKLHSKRNHINRFKDTYAGRWQYERIDENNIEECIQLNRKWCEENDCEHDESMRDEQCAVQQSFKAFFQLGLKGGLIRVDGNVIAFSIGEPLNSDTFVVHIEKADSAIQGAYPMINQQFVTDYCRDYQYINREDDVGDEGLRKAKLSYYPEMLHEKYRIFHKKG